jgi:tetratricopeptide (TPR) repeat protein
MATYRFAGLLALALALAAPATVPAQPVPLPSEPASGKKEAGHALTKEEARLAREAFRLNAEGLSLYRQGRLAEATRRAEAALAVCRRLYPVGRYPGGHPDLATSLVNLAFLLRARGDYEGALGYAGRALAMREKLYPGGHPHLALSLDYLGFLLRERGDYEGALGYHRRALAIYEKLYPEGRYPNGHPAVAASLTNLGGLLQDRGDYEGALPYLRRGLAMCEKLYPEDRYPDGHPDLARSLNNLGVLLQARGDYEGALGCSRRGLAMCEKLYPEGRYPDGHPDLARSLNNLGVLLQQRGDYEGALGYSRRGLAMCEKLYPGGHPLLADSLTNLGVLLHARGDYEGALSYLRRGLAMREKLYPEGRYPDGHPDLAASLNKLGHLLSDRGDYEGALSYLRRALAMCEKRYPGGHPELARSLNNLGVLLSGRGDHEGALGYHRRALAIYEKLYPGAHPELAASLNNLGGVLKDRGDYEGALAYHRRALTMVLKLYPKARYPDGHRNLAASLSIVGGLLRDRGDYEGALGYHRRALAMLERLFPAGHPRVATSLVNLGSLLQDRGDYEGALGCCRRALAMREKLYPEGRYPDGHPELAQSLNNLGSLLWARGDYNGALGYGRRTLAMYDRWGARLVTWVPESDALTFLAARPAIQDWYLVASLRAREPAGRTYGLLWRGKALLSRLLRRRHEAVRIAAAASEEVRKDWTALQETRAQIGHLLLRPPSDRGAGARELARLTGRKEELEERLARLLPKEVTDDELDQLGPTDLARLLPAETAFIDLFLHSRSKRDPKQLGKEGKRRIPYYTGFVVHPAHGVRRVELGPAGEIDKALSAWRECVADDRPDRAAAARVAEFVWAPLARALPAGVRTVYLAPEGELARLPWAALPGKEPGSVLLEDLALAVVPHGPFLLAELRRPPAPAAARDVVLALGAADYGPAGKGGYPPLPGTAAELRALAGASGKRAVVRLQGDKATWAALKEALPRAGYAHLATHGFFDARGLLKERQRLEKAQRAGPFQPADGVMRAGLALRSPLAYTGLALAGANRPGAEGAGGVVTGEALAELPLEGLRLCVLSACESGLGELGAVSGEGAQGLPRALHVAGCPNVVASLWNVNDRATAALMARFYYALWTEGKAPLEALRDAQLTVYRHPGRIASLADRSAPNHRDTVRLPADLRLKAGTAARSPTRLWAAFFLSGLGR